MTTLSNHIDLTQQLPILATSIMTDEDQYEVRCGMCARELYVGEDAYQFYTEALVSGSENLFRCEVCCEE